MQSGLPIGYINTPVSRVSYPSNENPEKKTLKTFEKKKNSIKYIGTRGNNDICKYLIRKIKVNYNSTVTGIKFNYHRLFLHYGYFDLWLIMYNQTMIIVPYLLMGPGLFTGAMTLGVLIQTSSAFREVQSSFSLFLQNWTRITELRSIYKRLMEFETAINFKKNLRKPIKSDVRA